LSKLTDQQEAAMRAAFLEAVQGIKDQARLADLQAAIARNDFEAAITVLGMDRAAFAPVESSLASSFAVGGTATAAAIGRVPVPNVGSVQFRFNVRDPAAERWLLTHSSELITEIVTDQRDVIRSALSQGVFRGDNPRTTALDLVGRINAATGKRQGGVIGLTSQQEGWIRNARAELERAHLPAERITDLISGRSKAIEVAPGDLYLNRKLRDQRFDGAVKRAIASGEPLSKADIDKAITQMQNRALKYRADVIARTESIDALRAGQHNAIMQAVELGEVDARDAMKTWDSSLDDRTREDHAAADGQTVPVDQPFIVAGEALMYPGDTSMGASAGNTIQCRCHEVVKIDFIGRQVRLEGFG
jgi:hypothetical protein